MSVGETSIRVPKPLHDRIKTQAASRGMRQADLLNAALDELSQADFLRAVAQTPWEESSAEDRAWDAADLTQPLEPWNPAE